MDDNQNNNAKVKKIKAVLMILVAVLVGGVLLRYINRYLFRSHASGDTVSLALNPKTATMPVDADTTISLVLTTVSSDGKVKGISGFDITLAKSDSLEITSADLPRDGTGNTSLYSLVYSGGNRYVYTAKYPDAQLPASVILPLHVKGNTNANATLSFLNNTGQVTGTTQGYVFMVASADTGSYTVGTGTPPTPSLTPAPTPTDTPTPPPGASPTPNPTLPPGVSPSPTPTAPPGVSPSAVPTPTIASPTAGLTGTPSVTPTPGAAGSVSLALKVKFQGVTGSFTPTVTSLPVKVTVSGGSLSAPLTQTVTFALGSNGVWAADATFDGLDTAGQYAVLIKGPKHLQKRVCVAAPAEDPAASYHCDSGTIKLTPGVNDLDFSGVIMLAGDIPAQDGIVNSIDASTVYNNIGKTDQEALDSSDLNYDGVVDTQDYSLILATLGIRYDDGAVTGQ